jgi:hypothetical protein
MLVRTALLSLLSIMLPSVTWGQAQPRNGVIVRTAGVQVQVQFHGAGAVRVTKWLPQGPPTKKSRRAR